MFAYTTAIEKLRNLKARKKVVQGGTSAAKTYSIIPIIIDWAAKNERKRITIVAESIPAVKDGAVKIFKDVMYDTNRWFEDRWISNPMEYTFGNGTVIQFKSFDTVGKAKASGKRDILFLNEANHINFEIADALMIRSKETWIDFNPDNEFWVHTEVLPEPNTDFIILTYKDNEACPKETLEDLEIKISKAFFDHSKSWSDPKNIKSEYWANWCKVYVLGEIGNLQGIIFDDWKHIDNIPSEAKYLGTGIDFGYINDPTTIIDLYQLGNDIYLDEQMYLTNQTNNDIAKFLKSKQNKGVNVADSAEPKSIKEISLQGVNIVGAAKGPDSIKNGIDLLKRFNVHVTKRSLNIIKEQRNYKWKVDNENKATNQPIDAFNHTMDAIRYIASHVLKTNVYSRKARIW
jgi:phage terminase large subunit